MNADRFQDEAVTELVHRAHAAPDDSDERWAIVAHFHGLATQEVFEAANELVRNPDPLHRSLGADILGQLGWAAQAFRDESVELLLPLLHDSNLDVVYSAICSLGHRGDARAIPGLCELGRHEDDDIRFGVAFAIGKFDDEAATETKLALMEDRSRDVRNWATFAFNLTETDSPAIRRALKARLLESDAEIRGEALIALASRGDAECTQAVLSELNREFAGSWVLEAATLLADPILLPGLIAAKESWSTEDQTAFGHQMDDAVAACSTKQHPTAPRH